MDAETGSEVKSATYRLIKNRENLLLQKIEKENSVAPAVIPAERVPEIKKICTDKILEFKDQLFNDSQI